MVLLVQVLVPVFNIVQDTKNLSLRSTLVPFGGNFPVIVQFHSFGIFGKRVAVPSPTSTVLSFDERGPSRGGEVFVACVGVICVNVTEAGINVGVKAVEVGTTADLVGKKVGVGVKVNVEEGKSAMV